jgi:hypothetical protein
MDWSLLGMKRNGASSSVKRRVLQRVFEALLMRGWINQMDAPRHKLARDEQQEAFARSWFSRAVLRAPWLPLARKS